MQVKVTILGPSETVSKTPAAVSVVTADDIRRSGAQSIPEALRLVPGLDVAQIDGSQWAVSSRGFNSEFANKLLVLQDGRSIYTPLFGGVLWDVQGAMMEDIDRIEVIRGPGATLWGANAVDGVINILSKSAQDTQGWLVSGGGGTFDQGFADARYGGKIGDNAFYRVYGTYMYARRHAVAERRRFAHRLATRTRRLPRGLEPVAGRFADLSRRRLWRRGA